MSRGAVTVTVALWRGKLNRLNMSGHGRTVLDHIVSAEKERSADVVAGPYIGLATVKLKMEIRCRCCVVVGSASSPRGCGAIASVIGTLPEV